MTFLTKLTLATALLSLSSAAPLGAGQKRHTKGFKITRVKNENFTGHSGKASLYKAAAKYGFSVSTAGASGEKVSDSVLAALTDPTSVTANPTANDVEYLVPVTVGSTQFLLDFDTGSSNLWVSLLVKHAPTYKDSHSNIDRSVAMELMLQPSINLLKVLLMAKVGLFHMVMEAVPRVMSTARLSQLVVPLSAMLL
jgi:hypothetical protein